MRFIINNFKLRLNKNNNKSAKQSKISYWPLQPLTKRSNGFYCACSIYYCISNLCNMGATKEIAQTQFVIQNILLQILEKIACVFEVKLFYGNAKQAEKKTRIQSTSLRKRKLSSNRSSFFLKLNKQMQTKRQAKD